MKSKAFENGFKSVACWKRIVTKTLRFWGEVVKTGAFENSDEKKSPTSDGPCSDWQRTLSDD